MRSQPPRPINQTPQQVVPVMRLNLRGNPTGNSTSISSTDRSSPMRNGISGHQIPNSYNSIPPEVQEGAFQDLRNMELARMGNGRAPRGLTRTVTNEDLHRQLRPDNFTRFPDLSNRSHAALASSVSKYHYDRNPNSSASLMHEDNRVRDSLNYLNWRQDNQHVNYNILTYMSSQNHPFQLYEYIMQRNNAAREGDYTRMHDLKENLYRRYSNEDVMFVTECEKNYIEFMLNTGLQYRRWTLINDFIIQNPIDDDAIVCIIGDWGTGLQDAVSLLEEAVFVRNATVILHLGDVYYSGLQMQMENCVINQLDKIRKKVKSNIRYYSVIGNHEYYCCGTGFMSTLQKCNKDAHDQQYASYFCLRNKSNTWQFIGVDTGYLDSNPTNQLTFGINPDIQPSEKQWVDDKIKNFSGSTILLSHHQLFSATEQVTDLNNKQKLNNMNPSLSRSFFEHLPFISAWFWGHQHTVYFYENDFEGIPRARLLGNSAFQIFTGQKPYQRQKLQTNVPLLDEDQKYFKRFTPAYVHDSTFKKDYYDHTYAIIDFGKAKKGSIPVEYYNVQATYLTVPPLGTLWFSETIPQKDFSMIPIPARKAQLYIKAEFGIYVGKSKLSHAPVLAVRPATHTFHKLSMKKNVIQHGDELKVIILDKQQPAKKFLTAYWGGVEYDTDHHQASTWIILKMNHKPGNNPVVHYKQTFFLKSKIYNEYFSDVRNQEFTRKLQEYKLMCFMVQDKQGKQMFINNDEKYTYSKTQKIEDGCITQ